MQTILIGKDLVPHKDADAADVNSKWLASNIVAGGLGIFSVGGAHKANAFVAGNDPIEFHISKGPGNGTYASPLVYHNNFKASFFGAVTPVAEVQVLGALGSIDNVVTGMNLPATIVAGDVAGITIYDLERSHEDKKREMYVEYVCVGGESLKTIIDKLVAKIQAKSDRVVTAANVTDTKFTFTARTAGHKFGIVPFGILSNADHFGYKEVFRSGSGLAVGYNSGVTTTVVAYVKGAGTGDMIQGKASDYDTERGDHKYWLFGDLMFSDPNLVDAGEVYDVYQIEWSVPNDNIIMPKANLMQVLYIAIPNDATEANTLLDTVLGVS